MSFIKRALGLETLLSWPVEQRGTMTIRVVTILVLAITSTVSATVAAPPSPNLCPHTENRYGHEDNAFYAARGSALEIRGSLISAAQLQSDGKTVGFAYLDDGANTWILLLPSADEATRDYFGGHGVNAAIPLSLYARDKNRQLPAWLRLASCPAL